MAFHTFKTVILRKAVFWLVVTPNIRGGWLDALNTDAGSGLAGGLNYRTNWGRNGRNACQHVLHS